MCRRSTKSNHTHAHDIVNAAIEIVKFINNHLEERKNQGKRNI